jgi:valyl-tRNA synthetase
MTVDQKEQVAIEVFAENAEVRKLLAQNRGAVGRLANVSEMKFVETSLAKAAAARSTARFDVRLIYERKIDVAAECERLKKDLEKIERGIASGQRQLGNEQFLAKAPANVVENLRKQQEEFTLLREKTESKLKELACS